MSSNNTADSPSASSDSGANFFQEIFISFVALSSLFVVLCLVRWFLQRNTTRRDSLPEKSSTDGLDSAAIAALLTFPYRKSGSDNKSDEENIGSSMECSICLSAVEEGEIVKVLPECMHSFHGDCVDLWLGGHTTCPVCRIQVLGSMSTASQRSRAEMVLSPVLELERQP
ncbi:RING/U-box superfamily protein [Rhynchospora pubera]|uniref:RING-type E3 ubiquitin transferase n=1 Tax=Rhynchospora pubera TaxID=906938 RepID=A0AAV8CDE2_9POAL|nr:RING/U-box superfamily protein [Rhynchospora pubera]